MSEEAEDDTSISTKDSSLSVEDVDSFNLASQSDYSEINDEEDADLESEVHDDRYFDDQNDINSSVDDGAYYPSSDNDSDAEVDSGGNKDSEESASVTVSENNNDSLDLKEGGNFDIIRRSGRVA